MDEPHLADDLPPAPRPRPTFRVRFNLFSLLLLMAAVACWISYWRTVQQTNDMAAKLPGLRDISRVLVINVPSEYAGLQRHQQWGDDYRWQVYLPPGNRYQILLATRGIDFQGLSKPEATASIAPGTHELELQYHKQDELWRISTLLDGTEVLSEVRPIAWNSGRGSSGGSALNSSRQSSTAEPFEIFRRRFAQPDTNGAFQTPDGPCEGILLWIDTVEEDGE